MLTKLILPLYVISATASLLTLKLSTKTGLPVSYVNNKLQWSINKYTVLGFSLYAFSFLTYMYLISKNDLGYIIPFAAAFVYIFLFTGSYFMFNEQFGITKIAGITLIMVGIIFLNLKK